MKRPESRIAVASLITLTFLTGSLVAQEPMEPDAPAYLVATDEHQLFHFVSHPWLNLHHFLYQWAGSETKKDDGSWSPYVDVAERERISELNEAERKIWDAALDVYREGLVEKSLNRGREMRELKGRIAAITVETLPSASDEDKALATLARAMPVYEAHWWKEHDRANREWTAAILPRLARFAPRLTRESAVSLGGEWPEETIRVDVVAYANWAGAYTSYGPAHIVHTSTRESHQGWRSLESVIHEAAHLPEMIRPVWGALNAAFGSRDNVPKDLWHVILFETVGERTRRLLAANDVPDYVPYAQRDGFYEGHWARLYRAVEAAWYPWLDGEIERDEAYRRLVEVWSEASGD